MRRAVVSVYDKTGLGPFCGELTAAGVEIVATTGTAAHLRKEGIEVVDVSSLTGEPEALGGRIKTLSWRLLAGVLAREGDSAELEVLGVAPIDAVVVNLYPFWKTAGRGGPLGPEEAELIDVGGITLLRAAAKNYCRVAAITRPDQYGQVLDDLRRNMDLSGPFRLQLAREAFEHVAWYDALIAARFQRAADHDTFPKVLAMAPAIVRQLRYGENPHQKAAMYHVSGLRGGVVEGRQLSGKKLSYNNVLDLDAAYSLVGEFDRPAASVVKHGNPCGCAVADTLHSAYSLALEGDPVSAYGCVVGLNQPVDVATATVIHGTFFVEAVAAPGFHQDALTVLRRKKNRRYVEIPPPSGTGWHVRTICGGLLAQQYDEEWTSPDQWRSMAERRPSAEELRDLQFGWKVVKYVRSNAVVLAKGEQVVGVGAGQMSRVDSAIIALRKAGDRARGAVLASDGFLPMPDTLEVAADAGVTALIEPGGSKGDQRVIEAANAHGVALLFTGRRHFRH